MTFARKEKRKGNSDDWWPIADAFWRTVLSGRSALKPQPVAVRIHRADQSAWRRQRAMRESNSIIRPNPAATAALVAMRQRVLIGLVADKHRLYGSGCVRRMDR